MANLPPASERPIPLRMRPDLVVRKQSAAGATVYVIKDPISLTHHRLWDEEFALLRMLDGKRSLATIRRLFESSFKPARLDASLFELLLAQFYRSGLILSERVGQGEQLYHRHQQERTKRWSASWLSLLSIRLRGFNPDKILSVCDRWFGWIFSTRWLVISALFELGTFVFILSQWPNVVHQFGALVADSAAAGVIGLAMAFIIMKGLHEFGHGLACKHFGGECNEMGLMFLAFAPCLYCDVSDSWMIESKWKRAFVAAAGVWIELLIATGCLWVWWLSHPGLVHSIAFNTFVLGTVSTILFNGNPLLRLDSYFVLSDLCDTPNLWRESRIVVRDSVRRVFSRTRMENPFGQFPARRWLLGIYGCASEVYRLALTTLIALVVYKFFQFARLELIGTIMSICIVASLLIQPIRLVFGALSRLENRREMRWNRIGLAFVACAAIICACCIPLPTKLVVPGTLQYANMQQIACRVEGQLVHAVPEGTFVKRGDEIARLESHSLEMELTARRGELERQRTRLSGLESMRGGDGTVSGLIPSVLESIEGLDQEVQRLEAEANQLVIFSPIDGVVMRPPVHDENAEQVEEESWEGMPLSHKNLGCWISRGTLLCQVSNMSQIEVIAWLRQSQADLVGQGLQSHVRIAQFPKQILAGFVTDVGLLSDARSKLTTNGNLIDLSISSDIHLAKEPVFAARIQIDAVDSRPINGAPATVTILISPSSLVTRTFKYLHEIFVFDPTVQGRIIQ